MLLSGARPSAVSSSGGGVRLQVVLGGCSARQWQSLNQSVSIHTHTCQALQDVLVPAITPKAPQVSEDGPYDCVQVVPPATAAAAAATVDAVGDRMHSHNASRCGNCCWGDLHMALIQAMLHLVIWTAAATRARLAGWPATAVFPEMLFSGCCVGNVNRSIYTYV